MSDISDNAIVRILLANHISVDASDAANILGAGIELISVDPATGMTVPFALMALISFRREDAGEAPAIEVTLEDASGNAVMLPSPAGPLGPPQAIRVAAANQLQERLFPGIYVPRGTVRPRVQVVLNFATGLPLAVGQSYSFRVRIDNQTKDHWVEPFYIPGPNPGPVIG